MAVRSVNLDQHNVTSSEGSLQFPVRWRFAQFTRTLSHISAAKMGELMDLEKGDVIIFNETKYAVEGSTEKSLGCLYRLLFGEAVDNTGLEITASYHGQWKRFKVIPVDNKSS